MHRIENSFISNRQILNEVKQKKPNQFDHIKRQLHATYVIHSFRLSEWPEFVENEQFSTKNDKQQANEAVKYPIKMKYENNANGK